MMRMLEGELSIGKIDEEGFDFFYAGRRHHVWLSCGEYSIIACQRLRGECGGCEFDVCPAAWTSIYSRLDALTAQAVLYHYLESNSGGNDAT